MRRAPHAAFRAASPAAAADRAARSRGFALPLVMLVLLVASIALSIALQRQSLNRLATSRQINGYEVHHMQAGLRELIEFWTTTFRRNADIDPATGQLGFDLTFNDGTRIEVRFTDAQGELKFDNSPSDPAPAVVLNAAADLLAAEGNTRFRTRGPGRVSIQTAPLNVLAALPRAIKPDADGNAFANDVLAARQRGRIKQADLRELTRVTGLSDVELHRLEACIAVEPNYWRIDARAYAPARSQPIWHQVGLATGVIRIEPNQAAPTGSRAGWAVLAWGEPSEFADTLEDGAGAP